jgi:hypothetical protein
MNLEKECLKIISNDFLKFIKDNIDKNWNWYSISRHPNISMEIIKNNPQLVWDWHGISQNPNITIEFIKR